MRGRRALAAAADILLRWGLRFRSPLAMRGRRALAAAADRRQPQKQQHKKKKAAGSCCCWLLLRWGFAPLANAPYGVLLRWILLLLCQSRHGRRPGPQKDNNTAAQQKSSSLQVGLRSARQCALRGAAVDPAAAAGLLEQRTFCWAA